MASRDAMLMLKVILVLFLFTPNPLKKKCLFQGPYNFSSRGGRFQTPPVEGKWSPPTYPTCSCTCITWKFLFFCHLLSYFLLHRFYTTIYSIFFTANVLLVHKRLQLFYNFKALWEPKVIFFVPTELQNMYIYLHMNGHTVCVIMCMNKILISLIKSTSAYSFQAIESLKGFEKKDSKVQSTAATNLSFLYFLVSLLNATKLTVITIV